jgi:hypothetical protein
MKKYVCIAILFLAIGGFSGFFAGRKTVTYSEVVKYTVGKQYDASYKLPKPATERITDVLKASDIFIPDNIVFPDTVDLRPTLYDWNMERKYSELIEGEFGKLTLNATVQYNRLNELNTSFVPVYKEITRYREKTFQPFASVSCSTFGYAGIGGGLFYRNLGFEYQYQRHFPTKKNGHLFGLKYKF